VLKIKKGAFTYDIQKKISLTVTVIHISASTYILASSLVEDFRLLQQLSFFVIVANYLASKGIF